MRTPAGPGFRLRGDAAAEIEVKKSRFIGQVFSIRDAEEAAGIVAKIRKEHFQARHHCTALIAGGTERSNDDGEPAGTAGAPMLQVLRGRGLRDVLAVVTRYFGGTLLGTGGLIRAYGQAVTAAIEAAGVSELRRLVAAQVTVPAADAGRAENQLRHFLSRHDLAPAALSASYGEQAGFAIVLPCHLGPQLARALAPVPVQLGEPFDGELPR